MDMIPTFEIINGDFFKEDKTLTFYNVYDYPETINVWSHHSKRMVKFHKDEDAAIENEFWDGECYEYISEEDLPNLKTVVLSCSRR